jgi:hypothetical protein
MKLVLNNSLKHFFFYACRDERRFTWSTIAEQLAEHINALSALKFLNPQSGKENVSIIILIDIKNKRKQ